MSAFMVNKFHIDLLVQGAFKGPRDAPSRWDPIWYSSLPADQSKLGQILVDQNVVSVRARYDDSDIPGLIPKWTGPYHYLQPGYQPTTVELIKAVHCYEYQSCETDDWEVTAAHSFCEWFKTELLRCLPGYEKAPWVWTERPTQPKYAEKLHLVIEMNSPAFLEFDDPSRETARILRDMAQRIDGNPSFSEGYSEPLRDFNGNEVGYFVVLAS